MKNPMTFKKGGRSVAVILIALACAIALNIAVSALPTSMTKYDTTSMKMLEMTEQTTDALSKLDKDVEIYWIVRTGAEDTYIQTMLERYGEVTKHLKVEKKDPDVHATFVQQYYDVSDVQDNSLVVKCGQRYQCVPYSEIFVMDEMAYLQYGEQNFTFEGEGALTGAIIYVTNPDVPKVYMLTNHGEADLSSAVISGMKRQGIELVEFSLLTSATVPEDADVILIHGPQRDISENEVTILSDYLKNGGSLLCILGDPTVGQEHKNLDRLLSAYGMIPQAGMVGEAEQNHYYTGSPALLLPDIYAHEITNPLKEVKAQIIVPYAKSLAIDPNRPETMKVTELLMTSKEAFAKQGTNQEAKKEEGDLEGPFAVAAASEDQTTGAKVVCIGAMYFLEENFDTLVGGSNQDFFLNAISWTCEYDDGIAIHPKSLAYETLNIENSTADLWIVVLLLIPVGFVVFGTVYFVQRRSK